jgi:glycosyltransferase involved in cell wall biosynthesis
VYPKISIITPNYNYGHFLEQTIQSVLSQGYTNLEYIIIDGGSSDNSVEVIKKYEKYLSYWVSEPDKGMYDAIAKGFQHSTGEILAWLNSDDIYFPWALQTVAEIFSSFKHVNWISSLQPGLMDYHGKILGFTQFKAFSGKAFYDGMYGMNKYFYNAIQQESTFWRRDLWMKAGAGFTPGYSMAGDFELWSRFFQLDELYGVISPLGCYRTQLLQKTNDGNNYNNQCRKILNSSKRTTDSLASLRKFMILSRLKNLPKIGPYLTKMFGYEGKIVHRYNPNSPESKWVIQTTRVL